MSLMPFVTAQLISWGRWAGMSNRLGYRAVSSTMRSQSASGRLDDDAAQTLDQAIAMLAADDRVILINRYLHQRLAKAEARRLRVSVSTYRRRLVAAQSLVAARFAVRHDMQSNQEIRL